MPEFIVANTVVDDALGSTALVRSYPMPVVPLSAIFIRLQAQLIAANTSDNWVQFCDLLNPIEFLYRGSQIWSVRGSDLARLGQALGVYHNRQENPLKTAASNRELVLCVPFGPRLWNEQFCFPFTERGESSLRITFTGASALYNTASLSIDYLALPGANPKSFLRATTLAATPAATGIQDFDLPRAFPIAGVGIVETNSAPTNASHDVASVKVLRNNEDHGYSLIQPSVARALIGLQGRMGLAGWEHAHVENTAGAYAQNATTDNSNSSVSWERDFLWLDFDPNDDGRWYLTPGGAADLKLRINFNAANAIRILPVEVFPATAVNILSARQLQQATR